MKSYTGYVLFNPTFGLYYRVTGTVGGWVNTPVLATLYVTKEAAVEALDPKHYAAVVRSIVLSVEE